MSKFTWIFGGVAVALILLAIGVGLWGTQPGRAAVLVGNLTSVEAIEDSKFFSVQSVTGVEEGFWVIYENEEVLPWDREEFREEKAKLGLEG
jgi:hypothetical protein